MSDFSLEEKNNDISRRLLATLKESRAKLEAIENSKTEPIAIIGLSCRFPGGANHPDGFWQILSDKVDVVQQIPKERWAPDIYYDSDPSSPGKMYTKFGSFLEQVDQFDAQFFGISPREANHLDPQQRLLLEVTWEALENAGIVPNKLNGSPTGTFIGIGQNDYAQLGLNSGNYRDISAYDGTGNGFCFASGRLSYFLGLQGPNIALDTACSSSLVSIHLACQSLRLQECNLAIAGGVHLILSPEITIFLSKARALSPDGRCKTFDASADGYGRGEGCGIVVLKRLSDALNNGDNILALIRGSAVNHDGASSGFTVPNKKAQEQLIRQALINAKVESSQVSYVEVHGTGTSLGDPIEVRALEAVFGQGREADDPLLIGSVKTNIGHLEAASGVAGLIKVVLSMQHQEIPPHLHFHQPNSYINWDEIPVKVTTERTSWQFLNKKQIAGVSSFGISGTNAHVILEAAPTLKPLSTQVKYPWHFLTLSAKTDKALQQLAYNYHQYLSKNPELSIKDICFSANTGRSHFNHRLSVVTPSSNQLQQQLANFIDGQKNLIGVRHTQIQTTSQREVAFLFTGQGSQYTDMGRQLYETHLTFRQTIDHCADFLRSYLDQPLLEILYPNKEHSQDLIHHTAYTQPALFALEYALFQLWKSWGIEPAVVMGHSVGEYVAACIAGVFSLEDGLKLIAERSRLIQALPQNGKMVAVFADEEQIAAAVQPYAQEVSIATVNSPKNVVISGVTEAVEAVSTTLKAQGFETRSLRISHAFHSSVMDPMLNSFEQLASQIQFQAPCIPMISTLSGQILPAEYVPDAHHWRRHTRETVKFMTGMENLLEQGYKLFLEIGPKPVLSKLGQQCCQQETVSWLPSLTVGKEDWQVILESLSVFYSQGVDINWDGFYDQNYPCKRLLLPTYPFQRKSYWIDNVASFMHGKQAESSSQDTHLVLNQSEIAESKSINQSSLSELGEDLNHQQENKLSIINFLRQIVPHYDAKRTDVFGNRLLLKALEDYSRACFHQLELPTNIQPKFSKLVAALVNVPYVAPIKREQLLNQYPELIGHVNLLDNCLAVYPKILNGEIDPLSVMFPNGSLDMVEQVYRSNPIADYYNKIVAQVVEKFIQSKHGEKTRIIEIGAGTGSTTEFVLPAVKDYDVEYTFSDISWSFLNKAKAQFSNYDFVNYKIYNVEQNFGFDNLFDIVIATNVIHATANINTTLGNVRRLLSNYGILILNETTSRLDFATLTFGLTDGWWLSADQHQRISNSPLLTGETWSEVMKESGFNYTVHHGNENQQVIVAYSGKELPASKTKRMKNIQSMLRSLLGSLLQFSPSELDIHTSFLEIGADSIILMDAAQSIENYYGIKISVREFFEELKTIDALASYIEQHLPSDSAEANLQQDKLEIEPVQQVAFMPTDTDRNANYKAGNREALLGTAKEKIIMQQLQVMSQQLEVLRDDNLSEGSSLASQIQQSQNIKLFNEDQPSQTLKEVSLPNSHQSDSLNSRSSGVSPVEPPQKQKLSQQQQEHLEALIRRYTQRTQKSRRQAQTYRPVLADRRSSSGFRLETKEMIYPIVAERCLGSKIWDVDGNEYVDLTMGFGVHLFGHGAPFIIKALQDEIERGNQVGPQSRLAGEVAKQICELTGVERVTFCSSGTEAVMTALRIGRAATGRAKVILFKDAYHGHSDGTLAVTRTVSGERQTIPMVPGVLQNAIKDVLVLNYGDRQALETIQAHADELAAVLVEPVQSRHPDLQPRTFLEQLRHLTEEAGIALIFDEIVTGFRIHPGGAQAWFDIKADIVTYGKVLGGGMPIGVVAGKSTYMDVIDGGMWNYGDNSSPQVEMTFFGGTFGKHPQTMATAKAVLDHLKLHGSALQEQLNQRTSQLAETLNAYFEQENVNIRIVYFGSIFRFTSSSNSSYLYQPLEMDLLFHHLIEKGVYIWEGRTCFLSTAHTNEDINKVIQAVKDSIAAMRKGGFFSTSLSNPSQNELQSERGSVKPSSSFRVGERDELKPSPFSLSPLTETYETNSPSVRDSTSKFIAPDLTTFPLTEAQKQLWALTKISEEGTLAYNIYLSLRLRGSFCLKTMRHAVQHVVNQHEALRTKIEVQGDVQSVIPILEIDIPLIDFSKIPPDQQEANVAEWFQKESKKSFDFVQENLFRAYILKLEEQQHLLVLTTHHIVIDGWSIGLILQEIGAFYSAECQDIICQLQPPMQFQEYTKWQQQQSQTEEMATHESYWLRKFTHAVPALNLPTDHARPPIKTYKGRRQTIRFDASFCLKIRKLSQKKNSTLFMTLLAVYTLLLHKLTNQDDIIVGIPTAGRPPSSLEGSERLVGYCAHLLAIRSTLVANCNFSEYLTLLRTELLDAYEHQDYPFAKLINKLKTSQNTNQSPLVTVTFNLDRPLTVPKMFQLEAELFSQPIYSTAFDISLNVLDIGDELVVDCDYNTDLFDSATITRMLSYFQTLLEGVIANPEQQIYKLPLLTEAEHNQLVIEWNTTQKDYPQTTCIHQLFEEQVQRNPDAVAVIFGNQCLSYRQLNQQANQLAHHLKFLGVKRGVSVAVYIERSHRMICALLGILKAGGAYVPLSIDYPAARIELILSSLQIPCIITQNSLLPAINVLQQLPTLEHIICLDELPDSDTQQILSTDRKCWNNTHLCQLSQENLPPQTSSDDLAYTIFTSGSTGIPKGVVVSHKSVVNLIDWMNRAFRVNATDRVLFVTSVCFDLSVYDIFGLLAAGGSIQVVPESDIHSPEKLLQMLQEQTITIWDSAPATLQQLTYFLEAELSANNSSFLRLVLLSGDWIPLKLPTLLQSAFPNVEVISLGGATEATVWSNYYPIIQVDSQWRSIPYGKPIQNARYYILDSYLNPCPIGIPGNLYIGGDCLAIGYANDPVQTAAKFIPDPFINNTQCRMYYTGDLAKFLPDGNIEFLGRIDHQVKIRGFRIELGEIDTVLSKHPQIHESLILLREDNPGEKRLVAYVVPLDPQQPPTTPEMRAHLKAYLPEYMIPAAFVLLNALPLTSNGKVDRRALPVPSVTRLNRSTIQDEQQTSVEQILAKIWAEVLGVRDISIYENFFELGGDSILAIQVISRANQAGLQLTPKQLFEHQTIHELAAVSGMGSAITAQQESVIGSVPLTPIQQWFFTHELSVRHHWNQAVLLECRQTLNIALLEQSLQYLLIHHDALRLRHYFTTAGWQQINRPPESDLSFRQVNLSMFSLTEQAAMRDTIVVQEQASLNLTEGPLVRVVYFERGYKTPPQLLIIIHQLVVDAASWRILLEDLETAYGQLIEQKPLQLPIKTTSYQYWAQKLHTVARTFTTAANDWLTQVLGSSIARFPLDNPTGENTEGFTDTVSVGLDLERTQALLHEVPHAYNTQTEDVLLTALAQTLQQIMVTDRIYINLERCGRENFFEDVNLARTVGWFTTVFPIMFKVEEVEPGKLLKSIKEQLRAIPHQGLSYGTLGHLSSNPQINALPQAEICFKFLGQLDVGIFSSSLFALSSDSCGPMRSPLNNRSHLLEISGFITDARLHLDWTYSKHLHHRKTIEQVAQTFVNYLEEVISHCQSSEIRGYTPSDFPLACLDQHKLDSLLALHSTIESIYPLTAMQENVLHYLRTSPAEGLYVLYLVYHLQNVTLDHELFSLAWQQLIKRHPVLRTSFVWEGLDEPLQIVHSEATLSIAEHDWGGQSRVRQEQYLQHLLETIRQRGFDLMTAPQMEINLCRIDDDEYYFIWSYSHMILDGWSAAQLMQEFCACYEALSQGQEPQLSPSQPFQDYLNWLAKQDLSETEIFWERTLQNFPIDNSLAALAESRRPWKRSLRGDGPFVSANCFQQNAVLDEMVSNSLREAARKYQVTLNTIVQGAWALVLSRYSQRQEVVFGVTVAGRPTALPGVESMVGLFIKTLPIRLNVPPTMDLAYWLKKLQVQQVELNHHEQTQRLYKYMNVLKEGLPLFDSCLAFENFPFEGLRSCGDRWNFVHSLVHAEYPLRVEVIPESVLLLSFSYAPTLFDDTTIAEILDCFQRILTHIAMESDLSLSDLLQ